MSLQHPQIPRIRTRLRCCIRHPVASQRRALRVYIHRPARRRIHNHTALLAAIAARDHIRATEHLRPVRCDDRVARTVAEGERVSGDLVIGRELVAAEAGGAAVFVGSDPGAVGELGGGEHAGAGVVVGVGDGVDDWGPVAEVAAGLVDELLAVGGVSLVAVYSFSEVKDGVGCGIEGLRVVANQLAVPDEEKGLPDWCQTVIWDSFATSRDTRHKVPGVSTVGRGVEVDLR